MKTTVSTSMNQQFFDNVINHNIDNVREILTKHKDKVDINCSYRSFTCFNKTAIERLFEDCAFYRDHSGSDAGFLKIKELIHLLVEHGAKIDSSLIRSALYRATEPDGTFLQLKVLFELRVNFDTIISCDTLLNGHEEVTVPLDFLGFVFSLLGFMPRNSLRKYKQNQVIQFLLLNGSRVTQTKKYLQAVHHKNEKNKEEEIKDMAIHWELIMLFFCLEKKNCYFIL
jgi:hypothetical protein